MRADDDKQEIYLVWPKSKFEVRSIGIASIATMNSTSGKQDSDHERYS